LLRRVERKVAEAQSARWEHSQPLAIRLDPAPQISGDVVVTGLAFLVQSECGLWIEIHREATVRIACEDGVDDLLARGLSIFLMKHPSWPK
jgi:hypothetical protein